MVKLKVFYDNLCIACSTEINHYKKQIGSEYIQFIDINSPEFSPEVENLDPFAIHKIMHAKKSDGTVLTKVDAFVAIWDILPRYHWLSRLAKNSIIRFFLDQGYVAFATARPYLPRRKNHDCSQSPYCDLNNKS